MGVSLLRKVFKELDVYSGIAIIFVVLIHANAYYLTSVLNLRTYAESGFFLTTIDQIIHGAVPMFIFISGFKFNLSKTKHYNYRTFAKSRLLRVLVPFIVISVFFILFNNLKGSTFDVVSLTAIMTNIVDDFIMIFYGFNYVYPLWYIPMYLLVILIYLHIAFQ